MVMEDCFILASHILEINLTAFDFRLLTSMDLKGELSGDLQGLSELQTL